MARCGCASNACNCVLANGVNTTVAGAGSAISPYTVNVSNEAIQDAIGAAMGCGLEYDDVANVVQINLSGQAGNTLQCLVDGLFSPAEVAYQTSLALGDFSHLLAGADGVWEHITEVPDLTLVEAGIYMVTATVLGTTGLLAGATDAEATVSASIALNGVRIAGTESVVSAINRDAGTAAPVTRVQSTGTISFFQAFAAGDVLRLFGARWVVDDDTTAIFSTVRGRTRLMAQRISL